MRSWKTQRAALTQSAKGILFSIFAFALLQGCGEADDPAAQAAHEPEIPYGSELIVDVVEIICPWAPGGSSDINARTIGQVVGEMLGQPVTVSNITGGGGAVGFTAQKDATPDGYTLGIITAELSTLPAQGKLSFDYGDIYPIIRMNTLPACIALPVDSPFDSLDELVEYARKNPNTLRNGHVGMGSIWHICAAMLEDNAGISMTHFAYDGAATAVQALLDGQLDLVVLETSVCNQFVNSADLKILAVMAEERLASFPEYSTCRELGYDIVGGSFQGIVCPSDVPDERKREWERILSDAFYSESYQTFCKEYGLEKSFLHSAEFSTFLEENLEHVTSIIKTLDLGE